MKTIEQLARKYCASICDECGSRNECNKIAIGGCLPTSHEFDSFISGFKRAEQWISVEKGLPENCDRLLLITSGIRMLKAQKLGVAKTKEVIVRFLDGTHEIGRRFQCNGDNYFWWGNIESFEKNDPRKITHWRPLHRV